MVYINLVNRNFGFEFLQQVILDDFSKWSSGRRQQQKCQTFEKSSKITCGKTEQSINGSGFG